MTDQALRQVPGFYRRRVGALVVTALSDGFIDIGLDALVGIEPQDASALLAQRFRCPSPRSSVNTFLVQGRGQTVLIDTGAGTGMGPTMGRMLENLSAAGVHPGQVDLVLLTHPHPDHAGGLAGPDGAAVFPNAALALSEADATFWLQQDADTMPERLRPYVRGAQASAAPYPLTLLGTAEAARGITLVPLPGHTPGHAGFRIADGDDQMLVWGDVMHVPDLQGLRPEVGVVYDLDGAQAIATRRRLLDEVSTDRTAVAGMHLHFPGFAHVARMGDGFAVVPETWVGAV